MKRMVLIGTVVLAGLAQTACVAVSAKDINTGVRYEAVAASNGHIYVVDKEKSCAWPVTMLEKRPAETEPADD